MASNPSDPRAPQPGSLQSMLARLRGMVQALKATESSGAKQEEMLPTWDEPAPVGASVAPPDASPTPMDGATAPSVTPEVVPVQSAKGPPALPQTEKPAPTADQDAAPMGAEEAPAALEAPRLCPHCQAPRKDEQVYCDECGWIFADVAASSAGFAQVPEQRLKERYVLAERISARGEIIRFRGLDHGKGSLEPVPIVVVRSPFTPAAETVPAAEEVPAASVEATGAPHAPAQAGAPSVEAAPIEPPWPSSAWERALLEKVSHSSLPRVLDQFTQDGFEYLVEELPIGQVLWDAWDDPQASAEQRFGWLKQIAGALHHLHQGGAILEGLRPDIVVVANGEHARLTDLSDLLPLPLPPNPPIRATHYTAPELVLNSELATARSDLYSFGAMVFALHLGRELTELDFEMQGVPKSIYQRFPDIHPLFGRLVSKTFCRELSQRFPTEEAAGEDTTGFAELIRTLETCRYTLDQPRLDIASWTTTGMVRTGNEDAFALLHTTEARENALNEAVLVLLADGMGGYEAGEVAAAMAIRAMRHYLAQQRLFAAAAEDSPPAQPEAGAEPTASAPDRELWKQRVATALREANQKVFEASRGAGRHNMGCTAEAVYAAGRDLVVGHVGDSRTYHLQAGNLVQMTRDQTWVNRMVEIGAFTPEEAEQHPRRNELQQAIGGHPEVEPAVYEATLKPGDWVVVCSDGLTNHLPPDTIKEILQSSASAETAARRLINLTNLAGATDNATVVVIRAT
jgi:PPM family protein phosphatase